MGQTLFDLLAGVLAQLFGEALIATIPARGSTAIVTIIVGSAGAFFVGYALFILGTAVVAARALPWPPTWAALGGLGLALLLILFMTALAGCCFRLMMKGVREVRGLAH